MFFAISIQRLVGWIDVFFQAEDGIRDLTVTGVQTCALPISRFQISSLHRNLKSGELGYEDEKFSYVIAAKEEVAKATARIIRHPLIGKGHIKLEIGRASCRERV